MGWLDKLTLLVKPLAKLGGAIADAVSARRRLQALEREAALAAKRDIDRRHVERRDLSGDKRPR